jgi:hypothetical protein
MKYELTDKQKDKLINIASSFSDSLSKAIDRVHLDEKESKKFGHLSLNSFLILFKYCNSIMCCRFKKAIDLQHEMDASIKKTIPIKLYDYLKTMSLY